MNNVTAFRLWHLDTFYSESKQDLRTELSVMVAYPFYDLLTIWKDGKILGIGAVFHVRQGIGQVTMYPSIYAKKYPITFHKSTKIMLEYCYKYLKLHRLQMTVRDKFYKGVKWAHKLGFEYEGRLLNYDIDGVDHHLFAKVV